MKISDDNALVAPCGLYCGACVAYKAKDNPKLRESLIAQGLREDCVPCPGCRLTDGNCPTLPTRCETYDCVDQRDVEYCFECNDFPCGRLSPAADRAAFLLHNVKMFNLCFIKEKGLARWLEEAGAIQNKYFKGQLTVGKGPQIE